ncbi:5'-deoxynucleotidase [Eubacterium oxidoreducens]|uniref:5'-deoxynucleotidase n=1 Tax=Eubacterium oxidoreducens TaxID=1732 RepID=A0A1G6AAZ4_EUBOX|nr:5'-deoxynucleotidase [Eubacterium oxidoreducens]SDB05549.1 5'-deoxynucleotidase [Eubacterium oxidoreducens]
MEKESYNFFAAIARMKYIDRWALMRNSREENLCEHSMEVAMLAHALCKIGNLYLNKNLNADKAAVIGLYHDASEIITGDMPTPVKYYSETIRSAYKEVEKVAEQKLIDKLPEEMRRDFSEIFWEEQPSKEDLYVRRLVKAADKLSALIKCINEEKAGNGEFHTAKNTIQKAVDEMCEELEEVKIFCDKFLKAYGQTLDELSE